MANEIPDDPEEQLLKNALAPKRVTGDSGSAEQHPIADQLAALDRYNSTRPAGVSGLGIRITKLIPGDSD